jgi:hypothetical protein
MVFEYSAGELERVRTGAAADRLYGSSLASEFLGVEHLGDGILTCKWGLPVQSVVVGEDGRSCRKAVFREPKIERQWWPTRFQPWQWPVH